MAQPERLPRRLPRASPTAPPWDEIVFIRQLWADPATMAPVGGPCELTEQRARDWYARKIDPGSPADCYCLIFNEQDKPVGEVSFHNLDEHMQAMLNIKIHAAERAKGYAADALRVFLAVFFRQVAGRVLVDDVALDNQAGQRLLLKLGFVQDQHRKDVCLLRMTRERFALLARNTSPGTSGCQHP